MTYILIVITLTTMPVPPYGLNRDEAPTVSLQEFAHENACQSAAKAIRDALDEKRRPMIKMLCTPKGNAR